MLTGYGGKNHNSTKQKLEEFTLKPEKMAIVSLMMSMQDSGQEVPIALVFLSIKNVIKEKNKLENIIYLTQSAL